MDGSLSLLEGWEVLQLHLGPHLGSGRVLDTVSAKRPLRGYASELRSKRKWRSCVRPLREVAQGRRKGQRATGTPVAQYSSVPGFSLRVLRVQLIRALERLHLRTQVLHPQTKPCLQVPSRGNQDCSENLCLSGGEPLCKPPSLGRSFSLALILLTLSSMVKMTPLCRLGPYPAERRPCPPEITQVWNEGTTQK